MLRQSHERVGVGVGDLVLVGYMRPRAQYAGKGLKKPAQKMPAGVCIGISFCLVGLIANAILSI